MDIVIIGSGNVATHLAKALYAAKHSIRQIYSRNVDNAKVLADVVEAEPVCAVQQIDTGADLYFISVKDDVIPELVSHMPDVNGIVVHTAGSVSMTVLSRFKNHGVFYPFQTFTKETEVDFSAIPVLVESNSESNTTTLLNTGKQLSNKVMKAGSEQRRDLHIAAVYACNFVNYMYHLADDVLKKSNLSFELLHPLILETATKVQKASPAKAQTGPAARKDYQVIEKHLETLKADAELHDVYNMLTNNIIGRVK